MKIFSRLSLATIALILFFNVLAVSQAKAQSVINEILKRIDAHQKSLSSLRSKVTMEKYNSQLQETDTTQGTAMYLRFANNQTAARIDWTKPAAESLAFMNGQYILYRPRLAQAIVGKFDKKGDAGLYNALSFLKMSRKEIKANYTVLYRGQEAVNNARTWNLVFTPKKPDLYRSAELWVDGNGMPIRAKVFQSNNDSTTVLLSDFTKNETIRVADFTIRLPKAIKFIKASANGSLCFKPANAKDALRYWSDAVFSGEVIAVNGADYTFKIERVWKGVAGSEAVVRTFSTTYGNAVKLTLGERYVVFAQKTTGKDKTVLGLMPCSLTSNLVSDGGKKILKEIGKGKPVKKPPTKKRLSVKSSQKRRS